LREQLRAQHSVRSDGSSENKQNTSAKRVSISRLKIKVHSPVKILNGDKHIGPSSRIPTSESIKKSGRVQNSRAKAHSSDSTHSTTREFIVFRNQKSRTSQHIKTSELQFSSFFTFPYAFEAILNLGYESAFHVMSILLLGSSSVTRFFESISKIFNHYGTHAFANPREPSS
jgi:hypothetical protein